MENCLSTEIIYTIKLGGELVRQELPTALIMT
jgi:hypothetical protein